MRKDVKNVHPVVIQHVKMKGKIELREHNEWVVIYPKNITHGANGEFTTEVEDYLQLHPYDVDWIYDSMLVFDNMEERIKSDPDVEFEIVEVQKLTGIAKYAKLKFK